MKLLLMTCLETVSPCTPLVYVYVESMAVLECIQLSIVESFVKRIKY